jgi:predicted site-specific integrase-resolvase
MKRSDYVQRLGVRSKTAWRWWRAGKLDASQVTTSAIILRASAPMALHPPTVAGVAVYARVSAAEHRPTLAGQADRLVAYYAANG